jgi:hypothetical protein
MDTVSESAKAMDTVSVSANALDTNTVAIAPHTGEGEPGGGASIHRIVDIIGDGPDCSHHRIAIGVVRALGEHTETGG